MTSTDLLIPPGATQTFVAMSGGRFRVLRSQRTGAGTPVLLIHGGGSDNAAISWYRLIEPLSRHHLVLAPDLPGFGYTTGIPVTDTAAAMADQLAGLLDELGIDTVIVFGISMGGEVALQFALRHPTRCAAVIPIAAGGLIEQYKGPFAHRMAWLFARLPDAVLFPMSRLANRFVRIALERMVHDPSSVPPEVFEEFAREARRPGSSDAYTRYNQAAIDRHRMRNNLLPVVDQIAAPALFFHGARDPLVDPEGSRCAAEKMPDARFVRVPDTGHWAQLEAHDRLLREVDDFLVETALRTHPGR